MRGRRSPDPAGVARRLPRRFGVLSLADDSAALHGARVGCDSPFLYFTDHEPDRQADFVGRRDEFNRFATSPIRAAGSIPIRRAGILSRGSAFVGNSETPGNMHACSISTVASSGCARPTPSSEPEAQTIRAFAKGEVLIVENVRLRGALDSREPRQPSGADRRTPCRCLHASSSSELPNEPGSSPVESATVFARATG